MLGYELTPGTSIQVAENDPALQMQILQIVAEHQASRAAAATARPEPSADDELVARLERLTALHESGALSDQEFAEAKRQMLD